MNEQKISYVELRYSGFALNETDELEVTDRNPFQIEKQPGLQGFRFFDKDIIRTETGIEEVKSNYSGWIYFGIRKKRAKLMEQLRERLETNINKLKTAKYDEVKLIELLNDCLYCTKLLFRFKIMDVDDACYTEGSEYYEMRPGDKTMGELIKEKESRRQKVKKYGKEWVVII